MKGNYFHMHLVPSPVTLKIKARREGIATSVNHQLLLEPNTSESNPAERASPFGEIPNHKFQIPNKVESFGHIICASGDITFTWVLHLSPTHLMSR